MSLCIVQSDRNFSIILWDRSKLKFFLQSVLIQKNSISIQISKNIYQFIQLKALKKLITIQKFLNFYYLYIGYILLELQSIKSCKNQMDQPQTKNDESQSQIAQPQQSQSQIIQEQKLQPIRIKQYFRFAKKLDYIFITVGIILSICLGSLNPMISLLWGQMLDSLSKRQNIINAAHNILRFYCLIGLLVCILSWIMNTCWLMIAKRQSIECRRRYFSSILSQEMGWFDCSEEKDLKSQLMKESMIFQEGMIGTFSNVIYLTILALSNIIFCLIKGWVLALVTVSILPLFLFSMYSILTLTFLKQQKQQKAYQKAAGAAEEALTAIKTIKALNGQQFQWTRYVKILKKKGGKKYAFLFGLAYGAFFGTTIFMFGLGFWFGANCLYETQHCPAAVARQKYTAGNILSISFSILTIGINMSRMPIAIRKLMEGRKAGARIFKIIDRQPKIKNPENGKKINNFVGIIEFHNVTFAYPKYPSKKILKSLNLRIDKHNNALVGDSGCGKSTILQLLMRFYDPDEGYITVDGHNLKQLDLVWWRNTIGYVGQQPVLFKGSIKDNLTFSKQDASDQEVIEALKKAEVWEFIKQLQQTINTQVGQGGGQISGGQKQRIAIARALIKKPKIMFLDEATSALDVRTERKIQKTLNKISKEIVSITVAHRLNTIQQADEIFCLKEGIVTQKGRFNELKRFERQKQRFLRRMKSLPEPEQQNINAPQIDYNNQNLQNIQKKQAYSKIIQNFSQSNMENSQSDEEQQNENQQKKVTKFSFKRLLTYLKGNVILFIVGLIVTAIFGSILPIFTVLLSQVIVMLTRGQQILEQVKFRTWIIFGMGALQLLLGSLQTIIFEIIGAKVQLKIRSKIFHKLLRLPIPFYEQKQNTVGEISSKLGIGCYHLKQFLTMYVYAIFQNVYTLCLAIGVAIFYQWRTALVFIALIPLSILASGLKVYLNISYGKENGKISKKSTFNPNEVFSNIRTVKSLGYEIIFTLIYIKSLKKIRRKTIKTSIVVGFFYGISQFLTYFISSFILYIGSVFMVNYNVQLQNIITAIFALNFAAQTIGNTSHMIPDASKCKQSISKLFEILDTEDEESMQISTRSKMIKDRKISNSIVFRDVSFKHSSRRYLFKKFNLVIPFGQKVGFVGNSGCGKSTIFSLLLRFYQPTSGQILLDDINIKDYDIHFLRSMFGIVQQEPILFNTSILENIKYNMEDANQSKINESLAMAQALVFIQNQTQNLSHSKQTPVLKKLSSLKSSVSILPEYSNRPINTQIQNTGIHKNVGPKGSHISGGQKQRLAIARTIIREPTVLLMDEATSNLDSKNQQKVQKNLDRHLKNKLFIVIAHRLETIKNSDIIFVFREGEIAQSGKYQELLQRQGQFLRLSKGH